MKMKSDAKILGENIRSVRKKQKITQETLAFDADISVKMLSEYENGKREMNSQVLFRIADALMIPVDELVPERLRVSQPEVHMAPDEEILLNMLQKMNPEARDLIMKMANQLSQTSVSIKPSMILFVGVC